MDSQRFKDIIEGIIRHLLQGAVVFLVAHGYVTDGQGSELLMAGGVVGAMIIWSVINKYGLYDKITAALGMAKLAPSVIAGPQMAVALDTAVADGVGKV